MADTFELEIATPDRLVLKERVSEAQIPGKDGFLGVLSGHAPLLSELACGMLSYVAEGRKHYMAIHRGFVEVMPEKTRVLAERAERADEIDVARAQAALERAQKRLGDLTPGIDMSRALNALERAQARIETVRHKQ
ncbi:MAG: F0F1 ATP synthase subunit epsilon [Bryobacteraceae bacterium]